MRDVAVVYQDGMMDMVEPQVLHTLIKDNEIVKFKRATGWAYPGIDPVRRMSSAIYQGHERRLS